MSIYGDEIEKGDQKVKIPPKEEIVGGFKVGVAHFQGARETMEDRHYSGVINIRIANEDQSVPIFGIFDGHGGIEAVDYIKTRLANYISEELTERNSLDDKDIRNALKIAFVRLNEDFNKLNQTSGSTAVVAIVIDGALWVANTGDSRAIAVHSNKDPVTQLSQDAKRSSGPRYENGLFKRQGKFNQNGQGHRIAKYEDKDHPSLGVLRSFGDIEFLGVTARPKITKYTIASGDKLVLACDGLWDVASSSQVATVLSILPTLSTANIATELVKNAYTCGSKDNVSAMVVDLSSSI